MEFLATYRSSRGTLEHQALTAASRAEALAQLRARGLVPLKLEEGASVPSGRGASSAKKSFPWVLLGLVLAALLGCAWWFFVRAPSAPSAPEASGAAVRPAKPKVDKAPRAVRPSKAEEQKAKRAEERAARRAALQARLAALEADRERRRAEEREALKPRRPDPPGTFRIKPRPLLFKTHAENTLSGIMRTRPGAGYLQRNLDSAFAQELVASFGEKIEVKPEDDAETREEKLAMVAAKEMLRKIYDEQGEAAMLEEVKAAQRELMAARDIQQQAEQELARMEREGEDPQVMLDFHAAAEKLLAERGGSGVANVSVARLRRQLAREQLAAKRRAARAAEAQKAADAQDVKSEDTKRDEK